MNYNDIYKKNRKVWGEEPNKLLQSVWNKAKPGSFFLDLGCGQGRDSLFMAKKKFNVTAIDISEEGISELRLASEKCNLNIDAVCQDIEKFKISNNKYSIINIFNSLHFLEKESAIKLIEEIKKNLKQGGFVVISDFTTQDPLFRKKRNKTKAFFRPKELLDLFFNFKIVLYEESSILDSGHPGCEQTHHHQIVELIAQKSK